MEALRVLEKDPEAHPEAKRRFQGLLEHVEESGKEPHLTLEELQTLADHPDKQPLPEHLRRCRICMEVFQVLRINRKLRPAFRSGSSASHESSDSTPRPLSRKRQTRLWITVSALFLALFVLRAAYLSPKLIIESGRIQLEGHTLAATTIPGRKDLEALQETQLSLLDGSRITLAPGTTFLIGTRLNRERHLTLRNGQLRVGMAGSSSRLVLEGGPIRILPGVATYSLEVSDEKVLLDIVQGELTVEAREGPVTLNAGDRRSWDL